MSIISLERKRMDKQIKFERNLLKELTLQMVEDQVNQAFRRLYHSEQLFETAIRDEIMEQAMESYLLGAEASRYMVLGDQLDDVYMRSLAHLEKIQYALLDYLRYWYKASETNPWPSFYVEKVTQQFVDYWWKEGLTRGGRRRKLRLD